MDNSKDLSPLAKGDIEIGKALPFAIFDRTGVLLLAQGQAISSQKQLDELAVKGLYHNPRWQSPGLHSGLAAGSVSPDNPRPSVHAKHPVQLTRSSRDPFERGDQLKMSLAGSQEMFNVQFIGTYGRDAIVVAHPTKNGKCVFVKEGQTWDFRAFHGVSTFKFSVMVEKVLLSPYPMLVLAWPHPSQLDTQSVRSSRRASCELPVTFQLAGGNPANGRFLNLSTGGAELYSPHAEDFLSSRDQIHVAFQVTLAGQRKYLLELDALVVSRTASPNQSDGYFWGLSFVGVSDTAFSVLHGFVCERLLELSRPDLYLPE